MADPVLPPDFEVIDPKRIDRKSGAPAGVRAAVGAAPTPRDRLSTLRKAFPDAQPYGALTEDMKATAKLAGPEAKRAMDLADRYTRFNMNVNMPTLQKIADIGADEQAYEWAVSEAAKGGSRLMRLRQNFTPDEWKIVAATVFDRLSQAAPNARGAAELGGAAHDFSISTFMTNWNKLAPEAKNALFGHPDMKASREAIDKLAQSGARLADVERMSNPSGTARALITGGSVVAAGERLAAGDPLSAAGLIASTTAGPYITAKMITNPAFTRWLAGLDTFGKGTGRDQMIGRLAVIAEANPEIRDELLRLQQVLSQPAALADR